MQEIARIIMIAKIGDETLELTAKDAEVAEKNRSAMGFEIRLRWPS